jgi:hypothetical protein
LFVELRLVKESAKTAFSIPACRGDKGPCLLCRIAFVAAIILRLSQKKRKLLSQPPGGHKPPIYPRSLRWLRSQESHDCRQEPVLTPQLRGDQVAHYGGVTVRASAIARPGPKTSTITHHPATRERPRPRRPRRYAGARTPPQRRGRQ